MKEKFIQIHTKTVSTVYNKIEKERNEENKRNEENE